MKKKITVVFDLDGTLIDSHESILQSIETTLEALEIKSTIPLTKKIIGPPLLSMLSIICGTKDLEKLIVVENKFKEIYDNLGYLYSKLYDGIPELLDKLKKEGFELCLVTNKRLIPTIKILELFRLDKFFSLVYTIDSSANQYKNKTETIAALLQDAQIDPVGAVYVGDTHEDYEAATNNRLSCLLVKWSYGIKGLNMHEDIQMNSLEELICNIQKIKWAHYF